jgi:hypothetical protein
MKHLSVRAIGAPNKEKFSLVILNQTHKFSEFGGGQPQINPWPGHIFLHGSVALVSSSASCKYAATKSNRAAWQFPPEITHVLYMEGQAQSKGRLDNVPCSAWPDVKAAVLAYNEFHKGGDS